MAAKRKGSKNKSKSNKSREDKVLTRNKLLRWDKKALIKMCKKIGVFCNGSKAQMVQRIVQKSANIPTKERKQRDKWFKKLNEVNEYGFKKKADFLITGFLSDVDPYRAIPMDLILFLIRYIGGFLELKFDKSIPDNYKHMIKHGGTAVIRGKSGEMHGDHYYPNRIIFCASKPFGIGKHAWHIKLKCKSNTKIPRDQIGILTDFRHMGYRWWGNDNGFANVRGDAYWISNIGKNVQYKIGREEMMRGVKCSDYVPWGKNDVVSILLNCNRWNVEFKINNKRVGKKLDIQKGMYYAAIESSCDKCQYKLVY